MKARYLLTALVWAVSLVGVGLWAQGTTSSESIMRITRDADGSVTIQNGSPQATTGIIAGTVEDATGGVIPGATIVLISETSGGRSVPAVTNAAGSYVVPNLEPGVYTVEVTMPGFRMLRWPGVRVATGARTVVPSLMMEAGFGGAPSQGFRMIQPGDAAGPILSGDDIGFRPVYSPNTPPGVVAGRLMVRVNGQWLEASSPFRLVPAR